MKKNFKIMILADKSSRLISRIIVIFNRRNFLIKNINIKYSKDSNNLYYNIGIECNDDQILNIIKQIEKLIGVIKVFYHNSENRKVFV